MDRLINIEVKSKDEIGVLTKAFKRMAENVNETMLNFSAAAEQVAAGSRQFLPQV